MRSTEGTGNTETALHGDTGTRSYIKGRGFAGSGVRGQDVHLDGDDAVPLRVVGRVWAW